MKHYKPEYFTKTKIVFTIGPATDDVGMLKELIAAGVDVCRINMAHVDPGWVPQIVGRVREASAALDRDIAIMMDVKGPEIRTADVPETFHLEKGELIEFTFGKGIGGETEEGIRRVDVNYPGFFNDVKVGEKVLVDSGLIHMKVLSIEGTTVRCKVLIPGPMGNRRHINLPGVYVNLPSLTDKDKEDIQASLEAGIDYIALSFVREAKDLKVLRDYLEENDSEARIIAKIEDQHGIKNLQAIIDASDGIMVARGDLGIECPFETLPRIQSETVNACIRACKPVIVATHMLESMTESPIPTRAEVTDVSNAIREQADCVMLSGETTVGKYPLECVQTMKRIAASIEDEKEIPPRDDVRIDDHRAMLLRSATGLAYAMEASTVVFTRRGFYAQQLSSLRPGHNVYAFTDIPGVYKHLRLVRGIEPFIIDFDGENFENTVELALSELRNRNWEKFNAPVVVVTKLRAKEGLLDTVQVRYIPHAQKRMD